MSKKLTARVQKLNPTIKEQESGFSFGIVLEPEAKEYNLSKGNVYILFDISSHSKLDTGLVQKMTLDVLQSSYYASDTTSPVQSLEKAISRVRDSISQLVQEGSLINTNIVFNSIGVVLWGNVLYVVQYEKGHAFIMHNTDVTPIETTGEGAFSSSSGLVKEDDVVILCTDTFVKKFPPKKLLTVAMSGRDLGVQDSCLLLKLIEDSSYPDFGLEDINSLDNANRGKLESLVDAIVNRVYSLGTIKPIKKDLVAAKPKINLKKSLKITKNTAISFGMLGLTTFIAFGVFNLFKYQEYLPKVSISNFVAGFSSKKESEGSSTMVSDSNLVTLQNEDTTQLSKQMPSDDTSNDEKNNITRVTVEQTLYDLIITDLNLKPNDIELFDNKLIVVDSTSGKIYTSILGDYKFLPIEETFIGVSNMVVNESGVLTFGDSNGLKTYDVNSLELKNSYSDKFSGGIGIFEDFIYTFDKDTLIKYTPSEDKSSLTSSVWGQSSDFLGARSLQVAYSIYIVTADNMVQKYTSGKKDDFEVKGLDIPFNDIVDLYVREDFKSIYVADKGNSRVVLLDLNGNFVKQFKYVNSAEWSNIKSIAISADEKTLYVLSGTKIYEISL